jgi:hypothetical protein
MVAFNPSILENWKTSGYKYIYVLPLKKYGVLQPLVNEKERKRGYTIQIDELNLIQMAEDYFLTKEKDGITQTIELR